MSFKTRMKKMNRGILLGVVILLALIIYIVVDNVRFNQSKDDIKNEAQKYAEAFAAASVSDVEGIWSKEDVEKYNQGLTQVINEYWSDNGVSTALIYGYEGKNDMIDYVSYFGNTSSYVGNVKNVKYDFTKVKVKKYGPGGAMLTGTIVMTGSVPQYNGFTFIGGCMYADYFTGVDDDKENEEGKISNATVDISVEIDATMIFTYEDGQWKICNQSMFWFDGKAGASYDEVVIEIGGSKDGNNTEGSSSEDRKSE